MLIIDMQMPTTEKKYVDVRIFPEGMATMPCMEHPYYKEMTVKELVRCKECYYKDEKRIMDEDALWCRQHHMYVTADWFCADGERRKE